MSKHRRIGTILILVGLCIPLLLLAFATKIEDITVQEAIAFRVGYPPQFDLVDKIQNLKIVLRKAAYVQKTPPLPPGFTLDREQPEDRSKPDARLPKEFLQERSEISIPYKYVFATGVLCLFAGITFLLLSSGTADTAVKR